MKDHTEREKFTAFVKDRLLHLDDPFDRNAWIDAISPEHEQGLDLILPTQDLNLRDANGRGFLLLALDAGCTSEWTIRGLARLNNQWWKPDQEGRLPGDHPNCTPDLIQALCAREWMAGIPAGRSGGMDHPGHPVRKIAMRWMQIRHGQ